MAFCKVCSCGEKTVFERRLGFPDHCPACGRRLVDFLTYSEDDPRVEELMKGRTGAEDRETEENVVSGGTTGGRGTYFFKLSNGREIRIPEEGCVIGRTETGAEELAEFPSVSRQHLRVTPRRSIGVLIEDISTYGTLVDGQKIAKNFPMRVSAGAKVTLCNLEVVLMMREGSDQ